MARWQNGKLTKCQVDKMSSWQNAKLTKCQVDKMQVEQMQVDEMQVDKMSSWFSAKGTKWLGTKPLALAECFAKLERHFILSMTKRFCSN